jgi:hypothetical protein
MDWIHFLALVYFCIVTPLASLGTVVIYVFLAAFLSAREDRRKESTGDYNDW